MVAVLPADAAILNANEQCGATAAGHCSIPSGFNRLVNSDFSKMNNDFCSCAQLQNSDEVLGTLARNILAVFY